MTVANRSISFLLVSSLTMIACPDEMTRSGILETAGDLHRLPPIESEQFAESSLARFEQLALRQHPTLVAAWSRVEAARGRLVQAGLYPNTVIGYHATQINNLGTAGQQGGFVNQRFITGGKRKLDQAVALQEMKSAELQFQAQRTRLLNDVHVRFYDVLIAQRRQEVAGQLVRIGNESVRASHVLLRATLGTEADVLQSEIESESSKMLYENTVNEHLEAWRRLTVVVGSPIMPLELVDGDVKQFRADFTWHDSLSDIIAKSPELAAAYALVSRAELTVAREIRERVPDVDVAVSVRHSIFTSSDVANVEVGVPIPYLNRNQGNIHRANADLVAARAEVRRIELELYDRLATSFKMYSNARQQVEKYASRILPRAEKSLRLIRNGYEKGQVDYQVLLTAQRTYFEVSLNYLSSLRQLRESSVLLDGQLLSGSLSASR